MLSPARVITLVVFVAIAAVEILAAADRGRDGMPTVTLAADGLTSNNRFLVTQAPPGSPLRVGERVYIDDPGELAAYEYHVLTIGSTLHLRRATPAPARTVGVPVTKDSSVRLGWPVGAIMALFLAVAVLVAVRGRASGSLSLAWMLALIVLIANPTAHWWPGWLLVAFTIGSGSITEAALWCATDFATRFAGDPAAAWARRYRRVALAIGAVAVVVSVGVAAAGFLLDQSPPAFFVASIVTFGAQIVCFLVALGIAYAQAPLAQKQRVAWVAASLTLGIAGFSIALVAALVGISEPTRDYPLVLLTAMPLGCAYAILRYRLLDIAFVVNSATVFGVTSLLVLAALALVDYGLQTLLGSWLVRTGLAVQLGLALAIGIATRPIHERVDGFIDDLFFRRRHETERALRQFARDVAHIDDSAVVIERTVEIVARTADVHCSLLLLAADGLHSVADSDDRRAQRSVDRNDGAIVRLRSTRETVDLHDVQTDIAGDFAFPLFARNRLLGALVCASRDGGAASYAPDERDAIAAVAHACGVALDLLRIEELERELAVLRDSRSGVPVLPPV
jgi:hypothetical protein